MVCTSKHLSHILLNKDIGVVEGITNIPFDNVSFQYLETFSTQDIVCWALVALPNKNLDVTSFGPFHVSTYPIITMDHRGLELCIPLLLTLEKHSMDLVEFDVYCITSVYIREIYKCPKCNTCHPEFWMLINPKRT